MIWSTMNALIGAEPAVQACDGVACPDVYGRIDRV